jgi:hypothetical protein
MSYQNYNEVNNELFVNCKTFVATPLLFQDIYFCKHPKLVMSSFYKRPKLVQCLVFPFRLVEIILFCLKVMTPTLSYNSWD